MNKSFATLLRPSQYVYYAQHQGSGFSFPTTYFWNELNAVVANNMDAANVLVNSATQIVFKLDGNNCVVSIERAGTGINALMTFRVGTDYSANTLQNAVTLSPLMYNASLSYSLNDLPNCVMISPTGFWLSWAGAWPMVVGTSAPVHVMGAAVMLDDNGGVLPNELLLWAGATCVSDLGTSALRSAMLEGFMTVWNYDRSKGQVTSSVKSNLPFLVLYSLGKTVPDSQDAIYGAPVRSPLPPYREVPMIRVFGGDSVTPGSVVQAERPYLVGDSSLAHWEFLHRATLGALPSGGVGRTALHWVR